MKITLYSEAPKKMTDKQIAEWPWSFNTWTSEELFPGWVRYKITVVIDPYELDSIDVGNVCAEVVEEDKR